jgi:cyclophilin family peptidyl-prolyl cis-trans isomerase/protein-disulfide isomerase
MQKRFLLFLTVLVLLASCRQAPEGDAPAPADETAGEAAPQASPTAAAVRPPSSVPCMLLNPPVTEAITIADMIAPADHVSGPEAAPVTMLVYSDFQCTGCAVLASILGQLHQDHPGQLRLVYRHFPQPDVYDKSTLAIQAAEAADLQGKFWEMHDLLYTRQAEWIGLAPGDFPAWVAAQAAGLGLDAGQFQADFAGEEVQARVAGAVGFAAGVQQPALPMLFINSTSPYSGLIDLASLETMFQFGLLQPRRFMACPPMTVDPLRQYTAALQTEYGDVVLQLYADKVPMTVSNFIFLAENGWYENITFQRVLAGFLVQSGDPTGTGLGNPGYFIPDEINPALSFDRPGMVAMANAGPNTNGSQFFITLAPAPQLDGSYTIFGEVLRGLDVLARLAPRDPQPGGPSLPPGDLLLNVIIDER